MNESPGLPTFSVTCRMFNYQSGTQVTTTTIPKISNVEEVEKTFYVSIYPGWSQLCETFE